VRDDAAIDALLMRWNLGDMDAAEEAILSCGPYLRMVVRRQLSTRARTKFDSVDIVQSVWADVVKCVRQSDVRFPDAARLRAYLARAAHHRLIDRLRQYRAALDTERPLSREPVIDQAESREERPSEVAQADDLWEQMVALCPPAHRDVLDLKRQGLPLAEIAARTGLHAGSVRRILYEVAKQLAFE